MPMSLSWCWEANFSPLYLQWLVRVVGLLYSCQSHYDIKLWQMLSVRNSCYKSKGKASSFISGGFAFDIRRPLPTKAEEQFLTVHFLSAALCLAAGQWWCSFKTSILYIHHHAESGIKYSKLGEVWYCCS